MIPSAIAVALLFTQTAAGAEAAPKTAVATTAKEQDKVVCRKEAPTGSLVAKKKCRTVRAWTELSEATRRELQQGVNSGGSNSN